MDFGIGLLKGLFQRLSICSYLKVCLDFNLTRACLTNSKFSTRHGRNEYFIDWIVDGKPRFNSATFSSHHRRHGDFCLANKLVTLGLLIVPTAYIESILFFHTAYTRINSFGVIVRPNLSSVKSLAQSVANVLFLSGSK